MEAVMLEDAKDVVRRRGVAGVGRHVTLPIKAKLVWCRGTRL